MSSVDFLDYFPSSLNCKCNATKIVTYSRDLSRYTTSNRKKTATLFQKPAVTLYFKLFVSYPNIADSKEIKQCIPHEEEGFWGLFYI